MGPIAKISIILSALFLSGSVQAALEGEYELISGPAECPTGSLQTLTIKEGKKRVFLFGSRHSWLMDMKEKSLVKEAVKGGCSYVWEYEKSKNRFENITTRSKCPGAEHDGVSTETMVLVNKKLTYEFADPKDMKFKCGYKKVAEPNKGEQ